MAVTDNYFKVPVPPGRARNEWVQVTIPPAAAAGPPDAGRSGDRHELSQRVVDPAAERLGGVAFRHLDVGDVGLAPPPAQLRSVRAPFTSVS